MCFTKVFKILFNLSKILCSLLFLKFLPAYIMVNSIWLVVLVHIPCLSHFEPIDSICAYTCSHQVILFKNYLSDSEVIPDMSWFSAIQTFIDCPTKCFQLIHPWSEVLLLILHFGNHNFFLFKHQTNQVILESDASAFFLLLSEYQYSHQLCYGSPDPLLGCYPTVSFIINHFVSSFSDT